MLIIRQDADIFIDPGPHNIDDISNAIHNDDNPQVKSTAEGWEYNGIHIDFLTNRTVRTIRNPSLLSQLTEDILDPELHQPRSTLHSRRHRQRHRHPQCLSQHPSPLEDRPREHKEQAGGLSGRVSNHPGPVTAGIDLERGGEKPDQIEVGPFSLDIERQARR